MPNPGPFKPHCSSQYFCQPGAEESLIATMSLPLRLRLRLCLLSAMHQRCLPWMQMPMVCPDLLSNPHRLQPVAFALAMKLRLRLRSASVLLFRWTSFYHRYQHQKLL
jgi:hypothetical protein